MILKIYNLIILLYFVSGITAVASEKDNEAVTVDIVGYVENVSRIKVTENTLIVDMLKIAKISKPWGSKQVVYIIDINHTVSADSPDNSNSEVKVFQYNEKSTVRDLKVNKDKLLVYVPPQKFTGF